MTWLNRVHFGDCRESMRKMIAAGVRVNCIVTSPPYWGLRDYGIPQSTWADGWVGCLGLEPDPEMFIKHTVEVFHLARELLADDGVLWLNMGDSYANDGKWGGETGGKQAYLDDASRKRAGREKRQTGLKAKDLCMIPARVAMALQADGWWLRSALPWIKRNGMPESTGDRPTQSVEYVYMLTKKARYFYDGEAVKVVSSPATHARLSQANLENQVGSERGHGGNKTNGPMKAVGKIPQNWHQSDKYHGELDEALAVMPSARNFRVTDPFFESWQGLWTDDGGEPLALIVNVNGYKGAHFATFSPKLIEPLILAGTSARGHCQQCGAGWERITKKGAADLAHQQACGADAQGEYHGEAVKEYAGTGAQDASATKARILEGMRESITTGWRATCKCGAEAVPGVVFDPFMGSGTTGQVAQQFGRNWIGCELNKSYGRLQEDRTRQAGLVLA